MNGRATGSRHCGRFLPTAVFPDVHGSLRTAYQMPVFPQQHSHLQIRAGLYLYHIHTHAFPSLALDLINFLTSL